MVRKCERKEKSIHRVLWKSDIMNEYALLCNRVCFCILSLSPSLSLSLSSALIHSFYLSLKKYKLLYAPSHLFINVVITNNFQGVSDPPTIRFSFPAGSSSSSESLQGFDPAGGLCQEVPRRLPQGHPLHAPQSHPGHRHGNPFQLCRWALPLHLAPCHGVGLARQDLS